MIPFRAAMFNTGGSSFNIADYFNTTVYTGNGGARSITTGIDLSANPGMVMISADTTVNPRIFDTLRGATKVLQVGVTSTESTDAQTLTAFNANGFSLGTNSAVNGSGISSNALTIREHPRLFKVINYTGTGASRSIAHGLSVAPGLVIIKDRTTGNDGVVWHKGLSANNFAYWSATAQDSNFPAVYFGNGTSAVNPDATNVYLGASGFLNGSGDSYAMHVFADDPSGYIASGTFIGNGSATGPVVTLGWEPQFILIKSRASADYWAMYDSASGLSSTKLWSPFARQALSVTALSTGFQLATTSSTVNQSGATYLYTAIRKP